MKNVLDCLKRANARIAQGDLQLREELQLRRDLSLEGFAHESMADAVDLELPGSEPAEDEFALETIVLRTGRPVLAVHEGDAVLDLDESDSRIWRKRLEDSMDNVRRVTAAVGRVELTNHPQFEWAGTAWLIGEEIVVTNRHVAELFGRAANGAFVFRMGLGGTPMEARIDFLEEFGRPEAQEFALEKILHIEPGNGPDVAFLRVRRKGQKELAAHIPLFDEQVASGQDVAVVGYPAKDTRIPDIQLMTSIFGEVFDKKRLAPGKVTGVNQINILHDCSTLGGNSGSVVFDLATGKAVALHYAGRFLDANFSVPAKVIADRLKRITSGETVIVRPAPVVTPSPDPSTPHTQPAPGIAASASQQTLVQRVDLHFTLPVEVAIQVGQPITGGAARTVSSAIPTPAEDVDEQVPEAPVESYRGRPGFDPEFL
ncbi:MAG: trypsin-like peptidase domain-containing protein, partial [Bryobacterales bacterium]|nr:trypsin-like peptidase domain-containing protein [Bryobacterales bacterium]